MDTHRNRSDGVEENHSLNPGLNLAQAAQNTDITCIYSRHVKFGHRSPSFCKRIGNILLIKGTINIQNNNDRKNHKELIYIQRSEFDFSMQRIPL